jgi:hypothetical protein
VALILDSVRPMYLSRLTSRLVFSAYLLLARAAIVPAQQPADTPSNTSDQKTKKVWTNDDLAPGSASAAPAAKEADLPRGVPPIMQTRNLPANCVANWKNCRRSGRTRANSSMS